MLDESSNLDREFFLLNFTKELIVNSKSFEMYELEEVLKKKFPSKEDKLEEVKEKIKNPLLKRKLFVPSSRSSMEIHDRRAPMRLPPMPPRKFRKPRVLRIPEQRFPIHLQDLKPVVTEEKISLGKLDAFVKDGNVRVIECLGENQNLFVIGKMGRKSTGVVLNKDEINEIISSFSRETKIPVEEGVTRMVFGSLMLIAIVSEETGSQFVVKKLA